jgi:hypothetical protein
MRMPRATPKGRQVDPQALAEIRALLANAERDSSLLIKFLHRIQGSYRQISAAHVVALAPRPAVELCACARRLQ